MVDEGIVFCGVQFACSVLSVLVILQTQQLSLSQENFTVDDMFTLFQSLFSKSLDLKRVDHIFVDEWDTYRKVS